MKRKASRAQLDLFEWAERRPSAKVLSAVPAIARRMWRERCQQPANRDGELITMQPRAEDHRRTA